ncbi:MAG: ABC-2 family transporter protein [Clostridia bacterium]|nr:ABC-2 family transporter protein [Clostridia bacterium]
MSIPKKYFRAFQMGLQSAMEYRADFFLSILSGGFIILIQCFLWTAVFASTQNPVVYGYTLPQMISYSIMAGLVAKMTSTGFEWEIAEDIKNGGLNKFIVQPIGYFYYRICCFLGRKVLQLGILMIISLFALVLCKIYLGFDLQLKRVLIFLPFVVLAMVLNFLIYYCISSLAFVMTEVWGVFIAAGQGVLMLSGGIFPLDIFGEGILKVLSLLPFKYLVFFPANIINGRFYPDEILYGAINQILWIVIMLFVSNACWRSGMKKYVAVGG